MRIEVMLYSGNKYVFNFLVIHSIKDCSFDLKMFLNNRFKLDCMVKSVIFDLGNVTIKFDETPTFMKWSSCGKFSFEEVKNYYENSSARKSFERGEITPKQFYEKYVK